MSIKIVIAEDSAYQRKVISQIIESHEDMEVVAIARNGVEALEKIEEHNPDVLILDLEMPKMSGVKVFEFLSKHYLLPTIILSISDPKTLDFETQAILLGAVDYMKKPEGRLDTEFSKIEEKLIENILISSKMNKNYVKNRDSFKKALNELKSSLGKTQGKKSIKEGASHKQIMQSKFSTAQTEESSSKIRVIIAEDSSFQRKIITGMIESQEDMEVVATARNGRDALKKVEKFNPDVLILDLLMPVMTGLEAFEILSGVKDPDELEEIKKYSAQIKNEIEKFEKDFEKNKEVAGRIFFYHFDPKFRIKTLLINKVCHKEPDKIYIFSTEPKGNHLNFSVRNDSKEVDLGKLMQKATEGFEDCTAGGHHSAAGAMILKKDREKFNKKIKEQGFIRDAEFEFKRKDGSTFFGSITDTAVRNGKGDIINYDGIIEDITERKKLENALKSSEEKYRMIIENTPVGYCRTTPGKKGAFLDSNPAFLKMYGFKSKDELLKINVSVFVLGS